VVWCELSGALSDFTLERSLALNHSFEVYVVARHPHVARLLQHVNNTHVIRTSVVANDPADFARNSFAQRTLNDVLMEQGHRGAEQRNIDLLRIVGADADGGSTADLVYFLVVDGVLKNVRQLSTADLVYFLVVDGVLKNVRQLHLTVYIGLSHCRRLLT